MKEVAQEALQKMAEAIAVEDMARPFFQRLLMDGDIPPTRHLCPELSMAPAFLSGLPFCFWPPVLPLCEAAEEALVHEAGVWGNPSI